jgi:hypothetical protein
MELVVAGHFFCDDAMPRILENDEVSQQVKETLLVQGALDDDLELRKRERSDLLAADCSPGLEPLRARPDHADPGLDAIGNDQCGVGVEKGGYLALIGL